MFVHFDIDLIESYHEFPRWWNQLRVWGVRWWRRKEGIRGCDCSIVVVTRTGFMWHFDSFLLFLMAIALHATHTYSCNNIVSLSKENPLRKNMSSKAQSNERKKNNKAIHTRQAISVCGYHFSIFEFEWNKILYEMKCHREVTQDISIYVCKHDSLNLNCCTQEIW